jgi:hypothetical protein
MNIPSFEEKLQHIRAVNGWIIYLEFSGIWHVKIEDKETGDLLGWTGFTSITVLLDLLKMPLDKPPWKEEECQASDQETKELHTKDTLPRS